MNDPARLHREHFSPPLTQSLAPKEPSGGRPALLSPSIDILLIGGASIILFGLVCLFASAEKMNPQVRWLVYQLGFVANFPHFLASYHLLYHDFRSQIFAKTKYFMAAFVVPLAIGASLAYCLFSESVPMLGLMVTLMLFISGWHYAMQTYGGVVVLNARENIYLSRLEGWSLKANLLCLWLLSWTAKNLNFRELPYKGITTFTLDLPRAWAFAFLVATIATAALVIITHALKFRRERKSVATWPAVLCWITLYVWFLPVLRHRSFVDWIPVFHSLQYLLFVAAFRRNKALDEAGPVETPAGRKRYYLGFYGYLAATVVTGAVFMAFLPQFLDSMRVVDSPVLGNRPLLLAFTVFINLHHFFIDAVMWRADNLEMRKYMFRPSPGPS